MSNINEENVKILFNEIINKALKEPYLNSMNALLSVLTHMLYHAHPSKEHRLCALKKIYESLLWNMDQIDKKGPFVEDHEDGVVRKDFVY